MPIYADKAAFKTVCVCDFCGAATETDTPDGVIPADWMTGQLWLDISMSQQSQTPLAFCPLCAVGVRAGGAISLSLAAPLPEPTEGSDPTDPTNPTDGSEP